jgi:hypothetical protein
MHFIGSGALLHHAANYALTAGLRVDGICCPPGDPAIARLRDRNVAVVESADPNNDMLGVIEACGNGIVFSINNKQIFDDRLLACGAKFFNIHNGLVQDCRGIAEICIFAALCRGVTRYGVTLQQLLPRHKVDSGPVVAQTEFPIGPHDRFFDVLRHSLDACRDIFEIHVRDIASNRHETRAVDAAKAALRYDDVESLYRGAEPAQLARACDLGRYRGFFPRLASMIESAHAAGTRTSEPPPSRRRTRLP